MPKNHAHVCWMVFDLGELGDCGLTIHHQAIIAKWWVRFM